MGMDCGAYAPLSISTAEVPGAAAAVRYTEGIVKLSGILFSILFIVLPLGASDTVATSRALAHAALESNGSWEVLSYLTDMIGPRLTGSEGAAKAVEWTTETAREEGLFVRQQPVMVPVWVRGEETAALVSQDDRKVYVTALGRSVATPPEGTPPVGAPPVAPPVPPAPPVVTVPLAPAPPATRAPPSGSLATPPTPATAPT